MSAHLTDPVPDPGQVMPALKGAVSRLITTCLQKNPADRFVNYKVMLKACRSAREQLENTSSSGLQLVRKPLLTKSPKSASGPKRDHKATDR